MQLYRVVLPVGDIEAAADFYQDLLDVKGERVSPGRHYVGRNPILALVDWRADGEDRDARPNQGQCYFSTDDLEAARDRAERIASPTPIRTMEWGETSFYLSDPWGNPLCVVLEGSEFTEGWVP